MVCVNRRSPRLFASETSREVATRFRAAVSSVVKWMQQHREAGSVASGRMGAYILRSVIE